MASVLLGHAPAKAEAGGGLTWQLNQILLHQRDVPFGSSVIKIRPNSAVFLASLTHSASPVEQSSPWSDVRPNWLTCPPHLEEQRQLLIIGVDSAHDLADLESLLKYPMADSLEQSSRVPLRPLHDSICDKVEPEYRTLHEKQYQYEEDTINLDMRAAPSKFRETSSPVSPVASVRNLNLKRISLRIYEPYRDSPLAVVAGVLYIHGGIQSSAYRIHAAAEAQTGGYVFGSVCSEEHIPSRYCHGQSTLHSL